MGKLRIVGLGPTNEKDLTVKALEAIHDESKNFSGRKRTMQSRIFAPTIFLTKLMIICTNPRTTSIPFTAPFARTCWNGRGTRTLLTSFPVIL